jgi:hypothetical protein
MIKSSFRAFTSFADRADSCHYPTGSYSSHYVILTLKLVIAGRKRVFTLKH